MPNSTATATNIETILFIACLLKKGGELASKRLFARLGRFLAHAPLAEDLPENNFRAWVACRPDAKLVLTGWE